MPDDTTAQTGQDAQHTAASQQSADSSAADAATQTQDAVSRAELEKVIGERQNAKERAKKAEAAMASLEAQLKELQATAVAEEDQAKLDALKAQEADAARKKALKDGDAEAIAEQAVAPWKQKVEALEQKLLRRDGQLTSTRRDDALLKASVAAGAHNPNQVVSLLQPRIVMEEDAQGEFAPKFFDAAGQPVYYVGENPVDMDAYVRSFLAQPDNANLVKSNTTPGSGAKPAGGGTTPPDGIPKTMDEFNALPPEKRQEMAMRMTTADRNKMLGATNPQSEGFL